MRNLAEAFKDFLNKAVNKELPIVIDLCSIAIATEAAIAPVDHGDDEISVFRKDVGDASVTTKDFANRIRTKRCYNASKNVCSRSFSCIFFPLILI